MATVPRACVLSQKHSVRGMSCRHVATRVVNRRRGFYVRANGLNKWANLEGMDDQCDPNPFDKDTAKVLLRVLTARSVKRLLYQLQELDMVTAQWLNNYAADNPPTTGNEFIEDLFNVQGTVIVDRATNVKRTIDPQNLAHRILQIRNDMAKKATLSLPEFVDLEDAKVMKKHLTKNTFVSGSHTDSSGSTKRRGYYR
ncbi:hypothetical protein M9435_000997 [Picochlorum sp. BPE23]|nr:hypothetical protein M9435_000997 [Picochlorum sp. BPE23]